MIGSDLPHNLVSVPPLPGGLKIAFLANSSWNLVHFREPLIADFVASGASVVAIAPADGRESKLRELGAGFARIDIDRSGLSPFADLRLLLSFRRVLQEVRPDVALAFTVKPNVWGSLAAASLGIPIINNVSGLGTAFIGRPLLRSIVSALYRLAFRKSAAVFFQNEEDRDQFLKDRLARPQQVALLPGSGVDLAHYQPDARATGRPFRFLFVGRLLRDKGLVELAEAASILKGMGHQIELVAVGAEDLDNRSAIETDMLADWARDGLIKFLGHQDDIRLELAACDCLVLPSYREGMPRSILEASASARPVIATDVPGCRQAVDDGVTGYLCEPRNPQSLAAAMMRMMDLTPAQRVEMGENGRKRMEQMFSQERVVTLYRSAIADIVKSQPEPSGCP
nr:glycosyltransferase family 4 protein [uncultured Sphingomonas sp.]